MFNVILIIILTLLIIQITFYSQRFAAQLFIQAAVPECGNTEVLHLGLNSGPLLQRLLGLRGDLQFNLYVFHNQFIIMFSVTSAAAFLVMNLVVIMEFNYYFTHFQYHHFIIPIIVRVLVHS